jgi:phosphatidylglycerol:prolipoprotein diacylglycerol transferase
MIPVLFEIGPVRVGSFGVMMALGFLVPTILLRKEFARTGLNLDLANGIAISAILGGLIGARIYYVFERWDIFLSDPVSLLFANSGLVWYGGMLGGAAAVIADARRKQVPVVLVADLMAPLLALGQMLGRIGCLLSADGDYGPPTDVPWAMSFPRGLVPTDERVHPTPLYDGLILSAVFGALWTSRKWRLPAGFRISLYLLLLGLGSLVTEVFRVTPKVFAGLTAGQLISSTLIFSGAVGMSISHARAGTGRDNPSVTSAAGDEQGN